MHKTESVLENKIPKILWDFEIQTNLKMLVRRIGLVLNDAKK